MLDLISSGFKSAREKLAGKATLTEENISDALETVRRSLLEADVSYDVVKDFLAQVKTKAVGETVQTRAGAGDMRRKASAGEHFIAICKDELEALMGPGDATLNLVSNRPTTILMAGLQGSGKTTTTGKLAHYLARKFKKKPLLVAADIYRPAAVEQLKVLGRKLNMPVFHVEGAKPQQICQRALTEAFDKGCDVILFDTAGRLTVDSELMQELREIKTLVNPDNTLLVIDSMMGQDAVTTAKAFDEAVGMSGVIMTKLDGDARGGAALSVRRVTGKPIKFLGMGEQLEKLDEFRPESLASRILGLGDILGLMEDFERVAEADREEDMERMLQGKFTFKDFYEQLSMIQRMGSLKDLVAKLPIQGMLPKDLNVDDNELVKIKAMIDSMTQKERVNPALFDRSRIERVARGSGRKVQEVVDLIKRFMQMRKMMASMGQGLKGLMGRIPGLGGLGQMGQMRQMAQAMASGGGMGGMPGMFGGGMPGERKPVNRDALKKKRKEERKQRKKNRR